MKKLVKRIVWFVRVVVTVYKMVKNRDVPEVDNLLEQKGGKNGFF